MHDRHFVKMKCKLQRDSEWKRMEVTQCGWQNYWCTVNNTNFQPAFRGRIIISQWDALPTWLCWLGRTVFSQSASTLNCCVFVLICVDSKFKNSSSFFWNILWCFSHCQTYFDSNYLRWERKILAIKKRQSAFLKYSLSGLIQDRNTIQSLALTDIKGKYKNNS